MAKKKKTVELPTTGPCAVCQGAMKHIRSIPAAAGLAPALHCFKCEVGDGHITAGPSAPIGSTRSGPLPFPIGCYAGAAAMRSRAARLRTFT